MKEKLIILIEIKKVLVSLGIELFRIKVILNGKCVYKIKGRGYNFCVIWIFLDLWLVYKYG